VTHVAHSLWSVAPAAGAGVTRQPSMRLP
jgi:hypothetical protein